MVCIHLTAAAPLRSEVAKMMEMLKVTFTILQPKLKISNSRKWAKCRGLD